MKTERPEDFEAFEEDFEEQDASYQVWMRGYDENETIPDYERLVRSFRSPEAAVDFAKDYVAGRHYETEAFPEEVSYVEVSVETVVQYEGRAENVGTLFASQFSV